MLQPSFSASPEKLLTGGYHKLPCSLALGRRRSGVGEGRGRCRGGGFDLVRNNIKPRGVTMSKQSAVAITGDTWITATPFCSPSARCYARCARCSLRSKRPCSLALERLGRWVAAGARHVVRAWLRRTAALVLTKKGGETGTIKGQISSDK